MPKLMQGKLDYMSVAEMDAWAQEQNAIAAHNLRVLYADLIQFADRRNEEWRRSGVLEEQRALRGKYGIIRRHQGGGRPCSYDREGIVWFLNECTRARCNQ